MSTTLLNKDTVTRKWYVLDAAGKPMGKTAALAADLLRGKLKTDYTPHVDCGDFVIIINAEQAVLTGKKLEQKYYRTHSGYPGGLHETQYKKLMKDKPELAMRLAVRGMLQKNTIAQWQLKRLKIYRGGEHEHAAVFQLGRKKIAFRNGISRFARRCRHELGQRRCHHDGNAGFANAGGDGTHFRRDARCDDRHVAAGIEHGRSVREVVDRDAGLRRGARERRAHIRHKVGGSGVVKQDGNAQRNRAGGVHVHRFLENSHDIDRQLHG